MILGNGVIRKLGDLGGQGADYLINQLTNHPKNKGTDFCKKFNPNICVSFLKFELNLSLSLNLRLFIGSKPQRKVRILRFSNEQIISSRFRRGYFVLSFLLESGSLSG